MGAENTVTTDRQFVPYGPPGTVVQIIRHFRDREVPDRLTQEILGQLGVGDGLLVRITQSLKFIGLLSDDGLTTAEFRALPSKTDEEYRGLLAGLIKSAYNSVFRVIPETPTDEQLFNAFRPFSPVGQRGRMVTLFKGLCRESGIPVTGNTQPIGARGPRVVRRPRTPSAAAAPVLAPGERVRDVVRQPQTATNGAHLDDAYHVLIGVLDPRTMTDEEQQAVWTLIRYLKKRDTPIEQ